ncbi:brain-specific angiogenesis inhibitor 1-associated protein 2-like isoform X9 [Poecilia reticulata]|uniref:brain-specific angiogenesis inhibitor 1-associated protein 2-like isoform X9 n=1 Tax=Poecilia reticulata TaxID=8081 RepID=UPI0007EB892B|nr:PREDICTED: brain-specific angiogenesis inhibitor 1-associated protein 2-like isoform X9 [Poecilia reticulata]
MVVTDAPARMSRTDEVHRITENVYKNIMEQFNPCLRNFIAMAKSYEKALTRDVLFQMAEVHRQIQIQLEEMLKSFHNELLTELEKKVELDARYLNAALKKYQMEHKSKGESLEKCQAELKKLRRKSQGSKHPSKYGDKEMQFVEAISNKQSELDNYIAEGYKNALSEERRRYCFLVDRQCAVAKNSSAYHNKGKELLSQKIPVWQQVCAEPTKLPDRAMFLAQQMSGAAGGVPPGALHPCISEPISGAKPLPMPPELAALRAGAAMGQQRLMDGAMPVMNGAAGGEDYQQWMESKVAQGKASPQPQRHGAEVYSNTLPVRKAAPTKSKTPQLETRTLPRSSSMAAGLERNGRTRVQAVFSHAAGDNSTLLSFAEGDVITLLVPEARDGWHYGENEKTRMRGWFPFSYTRLVSESNGDTMRQLRVHNLHHGKSSSTGNLLEREDMPLPGPDYGTHTRMSAQSTATLHRQQRPYSVAVPGFPQQGVEEYEPRFPTRSGPPSEPTVEAPAKPLLPDDDEEHLDEAHYDSLETSTATESP